MGDCTLTTNPMKEKVEQASNDDHNDDDDVEDDAGNLGCQKSG